MDLKTQGFVDFEEFVTFVKKIVQPKSTRIFERGELVEMFNSATQAHAHSQELLPLRAGPTTVARRVQPISPSPQAQAQKSVAPVAQTDEAKANSNHDFFSPSAMAGQDDDYQLASRQAPGKASTLLRSQPTFKSMNNSRSAFSMVHSSRDSDKGKFHSSGVTPKAATPRRSAQSPAEGCGLLSLSEFFNLCSSHELLDVGAKKEF